MSYYRIYLTNLGWFTQDIYETEEAARAAVVRKGYEASIYRLADPQESPRVTVMFSPIARWGVFSGWRE